MGGSGLNAAASMNPEAAPSTAVPDSVSQSRRFLKVLIAILGIEVAFAGVLRTGEAVQVVTGKSELEWSAALSLAALLLLPLMLYAIVRLRSAVRDMTTLIEAQRRSAEELRQTEQRMLRLMEDLPIAVFVTDASGRPIYSNRHSVELLGLDADPSLGPEALTEAYQVFIAGTTEPYPTDRLPVVRALAGETVDVEDIEIHHPDGRVVPVRVWGTPIKGPDGEIDYALAAFTDISERRKAEEAMKRASEIAQEGVRKAEAANRAKSDFLSRMSHELRTPLNSILGFSQLLEMEDLGADQKESAQHITKAGRHLLDLINEVLDLASIEAGRFSISLEPVAVRDVVDECVTMVGPLLKERELSITRTGDAIDEDAHVRADRQRFKQIMLNLLSNAVKYNRRGGSIAISWSSLSAETVTVTVADTGLGIPTDKLHRLFNAFDRLGMTDEQEEGTGLGLALSKRLAEVMGGDLSARSEHGKGSEFTIHLEAAVAPLQHHEATAPLEPVQQVLESSSVIVYIEDNVANVKLIERIFKKRPKIALQTVMLGQMGLDLARKLKPDLVLLDLNLPDMNGDEVLLHLRQDPVTSSIPVVLLSADATKRQIARLMDRGAAAYVTKPIDVKEFLATIDNVLAKSKGGSSG